LPHEVKANVRMSENANTVVRMILPSESLSGGGGGQ
jgi:hypothetical protein